MGKYNLVTILGPTASGKTQVAAQLAYRLQSAVISADSRQVYKDMDIGTGKDLNDYIVNNQQVPYYLINICNAGEKYNVFEFQKDFFNIFEKLKLQNKIPVLCGGTGLYLEAVLCGYQLPEVPINPNLRNQLKDKSLDELAKILSSYKKLHNKTDIDTRNRAIRAIEIAAFQSEHNHQLSKYTIPNSLNIGIVFTREELKKRITERLQKRLREGLIEEVEKLLKWGLLPEDLIYYGLEYKYVTLYLTHQLPYEEMVEKLNIAIHQFSKRQMTWFRRMERKGVTIYWLEGTLNMEQKIDRILNFLS